MPNCNSASNKTEKKSQKCKFQDKGICLKTMFCVYFIQRKYVIEEKQKVILEKVQKIGELKEEIDSINVTLQRKENELKSKTENFSNIINSLEIKLNSKEN